MLEMDSKIEVKQEIVSELASQTKNESFPKEFAMKNSDTKKWYDDCELGIKTEMKQEAPATDYFSQTERQQFAKDLVKNTDICTYSNDMENDTKTEESLASDAYSENDRPFLPKDLKMQMKKYSNEIEVKEEPWWLEKIIEAKSYCEETKDERNAVELPRLNTMVISQEPALNCNPQTRNDKSINPKQDSFEMKEISKGDTDNRGTFSNEEPLYAENAGQNIDGESHSLAPIQQNHSHGSEINKKNIVCKSTLFRHNLTDKCGNYDIIFSQLSSHKQQSSAHEAVNLQVCESTFTQMSKFQHHDLIYKGVKQHKCEICEKPFASLSKLKKHNLIHEGVKPYKCEICERSFNYSSNLKKHNLIHEGVKPHKCEICDRNFACPSNLRKHYLIHEGVKPYKCGLCERTFTSSSDLRKHNVIHEGVKPHKCEICERTFNFLSNLKQHYLVHKDVKPYICEICEKPFTQMTGLKQHILTHKGVKPHKCKLCEKAFTRSSSLKQHILTHEGVKPHKCEICKKMFSQRSHLKQHALIHEGVKPHKCEICEKAFIQLSSFKRHNLIHKGLKPHKCEICQKTYTHLSSLKQHKLIHEGVKLHN